MPEMDDDLASLRQPVLIVNTYCQILGRVEGSFITSSNSRLMFSSSSKVLYVRSCGQEDFHCSLIIITVIEPGLRYMSRSSQEIEAQLELSNRALN